VRSFSTRDSSQPMPVEVWPHLYGVSPGLTLGSWSSAHRLPAAGCTRGLESLDGHFTAQCNLGPRGTDMEFPPALAIYCTMDSMIGSKAQMLLKRPLHWTRRARGRVSSFHL
jgi:hypothetical protein